jgi:hypothetical protein
MGQELIRCLRSMVVLFRDNVAFVAKDRDPEQLLAEALRAQAAHALGGPPASPGFGLLSGSDLGLASRAQTRAKPPLAVLPPRRARLSGQVVILLAVVLGLACGAVAGLLTVL